MNDPYNEDRLTLLTSTALSHTVSGTLHGTAVTQQFVHSASYCHNVDAVESYCCLVGVFMSEEVKIE